MADEETKHTKPDEYDNLREEFRRVIVPLLRRSINDRPSDITTYCARYFETLLEERRRILPENQNQEDEFSKKEGKTVACEMKPQLQGSTSLPVLTSNAHGSRLCLRETSSWSNPSDSSSLPPRLWHMSYDVADTMSRIGDQMSNSTASEDILDKKRDNMGEMDENLNPDNKGKRKKDIDVNENENLFNVATKERQNSYLKNETRSHTVSECIDEVEQELTEIVNLASTSALGLPQPTNRKKWSVDVGSERQVEIKSKSPDISSGEDDNDSEEYIKPRNKSDVTVSLSKNSTGEDSSAGSPRFIPDLKGLENLVNPNGAEHLSTTASKEDIENVANSVARALQELIRGLNAMKLFLNTKLQKVKRLADSVQKPHLEEKIQAPPRKKRSAITFSTSNNQCKHADTFKTKLNLPDVVPHNDIDTELARELEKQEISDCKEKTALKTSEDPKSKNFVPKSTSSTDSITNLTDRASSESNTLYRRSKTHLEETESNKLSRSNDEGIVNKGFMMEDSKEDNGFYSRNFRQYHGQNDWRQKSRYDKSYQPRKPPQSKHFPSFRIPFPSSDRNSLSSQYTNKTRRMSQTRYETELPHIGEGGDSLTPNQRQCSVATETDTSQTSDRTGNLEARIRTFRIQPLSGERSETERISRETDRKDGSHRMIDESILRLMSPVSNNCTGVDDSKGESCKSKEESSNKFDTDSKKKPEQSLHNSSDTTKESEETEIDLKPTKKSSSLNPCAECFNPSSKSVILNVNPKLKPMKSPVESGNQLVKKKNDSFSNTNLQQLSSNFPDANVDWEYEILEDDMFLQDQEPILFTGLPSVDSEGENDALSLSLSEIEDQDIFEREIFAAEQGFNGPVAYLQEDHGLSGTANEFDNSTAPKNESDNSQTEERKKRSCDLGMKMAEGDRISESSQECFQGNNNTEEKEEEPGLSSACGDFVVSENNNAVENREENSRNDPGNDQNLNGPGTIIPDVAVSDSLPLNVENSSLQNNRHDEEIELNFACFSGSDSSYVDSSDVSDEGQFSEEDEPENDEEGLNI
ncbi:uncharacterized protein TNCV_106881 [Trichonephila clavipes]|nr:uncharacterized protein TNCV_106881 [Trichonephila clavipes]